jgi:hypothetical protein
MNSAWLDDGKPQRTSRMTRTPSSPLVTIGAA